jgi:hypothetical protein
VWWWVIAIVVLGSMDQVWTAPTPRVVVDVGFTLSLVLGISLLRIVARVTRVGSCEAESHEPAREWIHDHSNALAATGYGLLLLSVLFAVIRATQY